MPSPSLPHAVCLKKARDRGRVLRQPWCGAVGRLCLFDAVSYLSDELVDPLGGYAELSSRFASGDGWLKKAKALQQPGGALSALASVGRHVPDQGLVSALPTEDV